MALIWRHCFWIRKRFKPGSHKCCIKKFIYYLLVNLKLIATVSTHSTFLPLYPVPSPTISPKETTSGACVLLQKLRHGKQRGLLRRGVFSRWVARLYNGELIPSRLLPVTGSVFVYPLGKRPEKCSHPPVRLG